jgi:HEAT repeat protein/cytochrome c-type biogenesis protein CcmH/NrfG
VVGRLILAAVLVVTVKGPARADWQVHRDGSGALGERAEKALGERPDDDALARRLVRLVGRRGAADLRARLGARATGATSYAPVAAYAQILLALGEATAAAAAFGEALRLAPDAPGALAGRARALAAAGSPDARAAYDQAIAGQSRPAARRRLVEAALEMLPADPHDADLERAIALRRELVRLAPDDDRESDRLADALETAGRPAEAAAVLDRRLSPKGGLPNLPRALRAVRLRLADHAPDDAARAAETVRVLLARIPASATESRRAAWACAREVARARGTLGALADELGHAPGPVEWDLLGQIREELGDLDGALAAMQTARRLAPRDAEIGRRLLVLYDRLGRDADALETAEQLARENPSQIGFAVGLAERQERRGERAAAGAVFDRALARFAREPSALETLAETAARWGDDTRALAAWTRLVRVDPTSEVAVVGLGEAQFQAGRRDEARRTWSALRRRAATPAEGHLRLGELLYDHELLDDALVEARRAEAADAAGPRAHRLLAQIDERQRRLDDAAAEWGQVLELARPGHRDDAGLRREARTRLLTMLGRLGRGRLDAEVRRLREESRAHPDDLEAAMFLAEAEQRLGDAAGAIATLRALATAGAGAAPGPARDAAVEAGFALARLLKQTGQLDEAAGRLSELVRLAPDRARDAELQIAEIALDRGDSAGALASAAAAEDGADAAQLARIAEIRERAGDEGHAAATYRRAIARDPAPSAALALGRLLERQGDAMGAAAVIEAALTSARDDASVADTTRRALDLDEGLGRLTELASALAAGAGTAEETPARRRALTDVLGRLLPDLYRDPAADAARARLAPLALRPLLDLVVGADLPDRRAIELLGLLGSADAAPALARIAERDPAFDPGPPGPPGSAGARAPHTTAIAAAAPAAETRAAAVVALGRLGDPRGFAGLVRAATTGPLAARAAGLWALGRIADERVGPLLRRAVEDPRPEIAALACLGLGRHADAPGRALLVRIATDMARPSETRRAAALALGRAGGPEAVAALMTLADGGDADLSRAALMALGWTRDPRAWKPLAARVLLPAEFALGGPELPRAALGAWLAGVAPPDEARAITGSELSVREILAALVEPPAPGDATPLLAAHAGEIDALLGEALAGGGHARGAALDALDARTDGPGLGALAPVGSAPLPAGAAASLREIAWPLADRIAASLDDPDRRTRAAALRVLAKLDDERLSPARLAEAVTDGAPALGDAATTAARILVEAHPALAAPIAAAIAPLLAAESPAGWSARLSAVELLAVLGPPGLPALERAAGDRHPLVRGAAADALARARAAGPKRPPG